MDYYEARGPESWEKLISGFPPKQLLPTAQGHTKLFLVNLWFGALQLRPSR